MSGALLTTGWDVEAEKFLSGIMITIGSMAVIRRKCFISHYHADAAQVDRFITQFGPSHFIKRGVTMPEDVIDSNNVDYVIRRIRELYVKDSTVTIVLIGQCTWARKFVDWEVQASLRRPQDGLLAILLDRSRRPALPNRVQLNRDSGYANYHYYPLTASVLGDWIDDAYSARTTKAKHDHQSARALHIQPQVPVRWRRWVPAVGADAVPLRDFVLPALSTAARHPVSAPSRRRRPRAGRCCEEATASGRRECRRRGAWAIGRAGPTSRSLSFLEARFGTSLQWDSGRFGGEFGVGAAGPLTWWRAGLWPAIIAR